jgi:RNA polymerase primary sigma factor
MTPPSGRKPAPDPATREPTEFDRSAERERELIARAESGDAGAREQLVEAYLPSIGRMARRYKASTAVDRDELMQDGVVGLLRAAGRYDASMGTPFWAYATWWVRQAMQQLVAEMTRPVVLSDRALRMLAQIRDARREFAQTHCGEPTAAELVTATGLTRRQVESLLAVERAPHGLEEPVGVDDGFSATFGDLVADPAAEERYTDVLENIEGERLRDLADDLEERERHVLNSHYGLGCEARTLREIGDGLDLSVERVRQIEEKALRTLREAASAPS